MLPKMIDPRRCADQDIEYQGLMQATLLPRLVEAVEQLFEPATVRIHIFKDAQNRMRIQGEAQVVVKVICQRCMKPMTQQIDAEFNLVMVYSDAQAKALPKEYDAWVVEESANLHQMIEDELLLAMPIVALSDADECDAPDMATFNQHANSEIETRTVKRQSPFAVLKDLTEKPG